MILRLLSLSFSMRIKQFCDTKQWITIFSGRLLLKSGSHLQPASAALERSQNRFFRTGQKRNNPLGYFSRDEKIVSGKSQKNNPAGYFDELDCCGHFDPSGLFFDICWDHIFVSGKITRTTSSEKRTGQNPAFDPVLGSLHCSTYVFLSPTAPGTLAHMFWGRFVGATYVETLVLKWTVVFSRSSTGKLEYGKVLVQQGAYQKTTNQ